MGPERLNYALLLFGEYALLLFGDRPINLSAPIGRVRMLTGVGHILFPRRAGGFKSIRFDPSLNGGVSFPKSLIRAGVDTQCDGTARQHP
jgi:hypothetical protein